MEEMKMNPLSDPGEDVSSFGFSLLSKALWGGVGLGSVVFTVLMGYVISTRPPIRQGERPPLFEDVVDISDSITKKELRSTVRSLSNLGSRLVGREGCDDASKYVLERFRFEGLRDVKADQFNVTIPGPAEASIDFEDGVRIPIHPFWPNGVRPAVLAPEGEELRIVDVGKGMGVDLDGKEVEDSAVILDLMSGRRWMDLAGLGARLLLFPEDPNILRPEAEDKVASIPIDMPRFWVEDRHAEELRARHNQRALVRSQLSWENRVGWNVMGWLDGTEPDSGDAPVVLAAYYDAVSVVPDLCPGADQAASMACLFQLLKVLSANRPARSVLFLATSSHCYGLQGMRDFVERYLLTQALEPAMVICLDLSSGSSRLGCFFKGSLVEQEENNLKSRFAELGRTLLSESRALEQALGVGTGQRYVDAINNTAGKNWRCYFPGPFPGEHELVNMAGIPSVCFATVDDARRYWDTPLDRFERVRWDELLDQVRFLCCLLPDWINRSGPFLRRSPDRVWTSLVGRTVTFDMQSSYVPDDPVQGALVMIRSPWEQDFMAGIRGVPVLTSDENGVFRFGGLPSVKGSGGYWGQQKVEMFVVDGLTGDVVMAPNLGPEGALNYPLEVQMDFEEKEVTAVMFPCDTLSLYDLVDQRTYRPFRVIDIYDARTNSSPFEYGYSLSHRHPCATVYVRQGGSVRVAMGIGPVGRQLVLLNGSREDPLGVGFQSSSKRTIKRIPFAAARDLWNLNEMRLERLRSRGVSNSLAQELHDEALRHILQAEEALLTNKLGEFLSASRAAWSTEARAYPDILSTTNDVVKGALFHLFLVLPFSYFTERLLIGSRSLDKRIMGTAGVFMVTFMVYRYLHPAFALTLTPFIVLLAFVIGTLSILVIVIVIKKFEERLEQMKTESLGVHQADLERLSAALVAFTLGISSMRRRRVRTGLTCSSIVLLTFTILSFTSVTPQLRRNEVEFRRGNPAYRGLLVRDRIWSPLLPEVYEGLREEMGKDAVIAPRAWYYSALVGQRSFVEVDYLQRGASLTVSSILGMSQGEKDIFPVEQMLTAGRWLKDGALEVIVPTNVAWDLGLLPSDVEEAKLRVLGLDLLLVGICDPSRVKAVPDLDGEMITPVDHLLMAEKRREEGEPDPDELERYVHMAPESTIIMPYDLLLPMGGQLRSVALGAETDEIVSDILNQLMVRAEFTVFSCDGKQVKLYSSIGRMGLGGTRSLFVPMVLAGMIVLNTMLGSVSERTREIGVYSSVGLAPSHVGALFLAEASVYALIGGVCGFIMGQAVAKVAVEFSLLADAGVNYSSMSAVGISVSVMGIVLLSALYPARMASRVAVPALERQWRLPSPQGEEIVLDLPFTVSGSSALGILGYLYEFLSAHVERSVGHFATDNVALRLGMQDEVELLFDVWLAPFDLGVSQNTILRALAQDEDGFRGLRMVMRRLSGDEASWISVNRTFINGMRKQFLIWRTLRVADRERYTQWVEQILRKE